MDNLDILEELLAVNRDVAMSFVRQANQEADGQPLNVQMQLHAARRTQLADLIAEHRVSE
jgi:hypothetical protein